MATLEKIRSKAGLLVGVVGIALFAFVIGDFLNSGSSLLRKSQETVGVVDGENISIYDYDARYQEMASIYKMQYGETLPEDVNNYIRIAVWDEMVNEILIGEQTSKIGMTVTADELYDMVNGEQVHMMVQQMPMFTDPNTGTFNRDILLHFMQTIHSEDFSMYGPEGERQIRAWKDYWLFYEQVIKRSRLIEKYNTLLTKALKANKLEIENQVDRKSVV